MLIITFRKLPELVPNREVRTVRMEQLWGSRFREQVSPRMPLVLSASKSSVGG